MHLRAGFGAGDKCCRRPLTAPSPASNRRAAIFAKRHRRPIDGPTLREKSQRVSRTGSCRTRCSFGRRGARARRTTGRYRFLLQTRPVARLYRRVRRPARRTAEEREENYSSTPRCSTSAGRSSTGWQEQQNAASALSPFTATVACWGGRPPPQSGITGVATLNELVFSAAIMH